MRDEKYVLGGHEQSYQLPGAFSHGMSFGIE